MKVFVISNPVAGKRFQQGLRLPDWITSDAQQVIHRETEYQGHGESLAKEACQQGFDTIIAAGGDGTIHEILNGVVSSQSSKVRMAIMPMGTANDYAYSLAQRPTHRERFTQRVDIGALDCNGQRRYFANVAGIGFPGRVAELARGMKRLPARLRYTLAILRCMGASYRTDPVRIDAQEPKSYLMISAAIGLREGSYPLTPHAKLDDGLFDLLLVGALRRRDIVRYFPRMIRGDIPTSDPRITTDRKSKIEIESAARIPLHLDGEDPWRALRPAALGQEFRLVLSVIPRAIVMELCEKEGLER
jgi:diacylglycerol kinase family enzyme